MARNFVKDIRIKVGGNIFLSVYVFIFIPPSPLDDHLALGDIFTRTDATRVLETTNY